MRVINKIVFRITLILIVIAIISCKSKKLLEKNNKEQSLSAYIELARNLGIENEVWIERLYDYTVDINNFQVFYDNGVDLRKVYGKDYKSRVFTSDVIVEGTILSKNTDKNEDVYFHSIYEVEINKVLKNYNWQKTKKIKLVTESGPVGDKMFNLVNEDSFVVGEKVLIYLEPIEKTIDHYDKLDFELQKKRKINVNGDIDNTFRPLKKYILKDGKFVDASKYHESEIGNRKEVLKFICKMVALNKAW